MSTSISPPGSSPDELLFYPSYSTEPEKVLAIEEDTVNGVKQNVLALKAFNSDTDCGAEVCHKRVTDAAVVMLTGMYASSRFDVTAKVPQEEVSGSPHFTAVP